MGYLLARVNATAVHAFGWDHAGSADVLVKMSVWEPVEAWWIPFTLRERFPPPDAAAPGPIPPRGTDPALRADPAPGNGPRLRLGRPTVV